MSGRASCTAARQKPKRKTRLDPPGLKPWSCTATAAASNAGGTPSSASAARSAAGSRSPEAIVGDAGLRQPPAKLVERAVAHHPRAAGAHLVQVVGERGGGLFRGHEGEAGGEVVLHRRPVGPAAHHRAAEEHGLAARRRCADLRRHHLRARRHHELDGVLERLAGHGEQHVRRARAHVHGQDAECGEAVVLRGGTRAGRGRACRARFAGARHRVSGRARVTGALRRPRAGRARVAGAHRRVGTPLKRSFQTFVMASSTMSLLILLSPTLRSTKMMGSSTTLKPSL